MMTVDIRNAKDARTSGARFRSLDETAIVETRDLYRALGTEGAAERTILHGVSLAIPRGQFVALTGSSGSGKSTLLYLLGALDRQTAGEVWLDGVEIGALDDA